VATRVLIVDDSAFFRKRLSEIISADPGLEIAGTASNGQEAVEQAITLKPDVITMDMEMPVMDGISAVRKIMAHHPIPILMLSTWTTDGAKSTLDALEAGAADFLPKRFADLSTDQNIAHQKICQRLHHLATNFRGKTHVTHSLNPALKPPTTFSVKNTASSLLNQTKLVVLATSTGGPVALQKVLTQLPATFPHPILLIQHMPATFTPSFAERLNKQCAITVKQADDGDVLTPGTAFLAPGGKQMLVRGNKNRQYLTIEDGNATYNPCVDITLESITRICPAETLAVVLTGMGSDGRDGCIHIHKLGGVIWSQDEQSCTVYGMPMAIATAGIADKILSLDNIGQQLAELS